MTNRKVAFADCSMHKMPRGLYVADMYEKGSNSARQRQKRNTAVATPTRSQVCKAFKYISSALV